MIFVYTFKGVVFNYAGGCDENKINILLVLRTMKGLRILLV